MHQHWRTKSSFSAWSQAPACFSSFTGDFQNVKSVLRQILSIIRAIAKYSLNWYICYIQLTANILTEAEKHTASKYSLIVTFWKMAMVRQGYTAHSPHKDTPLLLNDVEAERFLYRCGTLALPELFPHFSLTFPGKGQKNMLSLLLSREAMTGDWSSRPMPWQEFLWLLLL